MSKSEKRFYLGAEQSASGAPHFQVPSSEPRGGEGGKHPTRGWQTSESRVKKKERQRVANIRLEGGKHPSSE
jgi:hypothetical protein